MCTDDAGGDLSASWRAAFDKSSTATKACLQHATDLLGAARAVQGAGKPTIAYHLAALALEEVGKTVLIGVAHLPSPARDDATDWARRSWDDHVAKLFWALWGPSFGRQKVTREQLQSYRDLARGIHETRLATLYFPWIDEHVEQEVRPATEGEAAALIDLAEAGIEMARSREHPVVDRETVTLMQWFSAAARDPERSRLIFGSKAMDRLVELGDTREWVSWLKEQFDASEAEVQQHISLELGRERPGPREAREPKWQIKVRLASGSHSIRPRTLSWWNTRVKPVQLHPVGQKQKRNELIAVLTLPKDVPLRAVYESARVFTQRFVIALNIGSMGFFWYYLPTHVARFYESLTDLDEPSHQLFVDNAPPLVLESQQSGLSDQDLSRTALCFAMLPDPRDAGFEPFSHYDRGLALLSKNDIHFRCEPHAYGQFYQSLRSGTRAYGDWDGASPFGPCFHHVLGDVMPCEEDRRTYLDLGEGFDGAGGVPDGIALNEVGIIKALADHYFLRTFSRMARERRGPDPEGPP